MVHINTIEFLNLKQYSNIISIDKEQISPSQIDIWIKMNSITHAQICPNCNSYSLKRIKDYPISHIKHSIDEKRPIYLHVSNVRYYCPECHHTFMNALPFVFKSFPSLTRETVIRILNKLQYTNCSFNEVAVLHHVSNQTVLRIFNEYIDFNIGKPTPYMCIDEKCYVHGNTKFCLPILDFETNKLIDVLKNRKKMTLIDYLRRVRTLYGDPNSNNYVEIKMICIDMSQSYYDAITLIYPNTLIAVDSFHVIKTINEALNDVRLRVMKRYYKKENEIDPRTGKLLDEAVRDIHQPIEYRMLKTHWKLILSNKEFRYDENEPKRYNKMLHRFTDIKDILDYLLSIDESLAYAWAIKERYMYFNETATYETAPEWLDDIINDFAQSGIKECIKVSKTLIHWRQNIINSFIRYNGRRISNGPIEGMNSSIQKLIVNSNGMPVFKTLRKRILIRHSNNVSYKLK